MIMSGLRRRARRWAGSGVSSGTPLRAVVVYGFTPADPTHLDLLAGRADVIVYHSQWRPDQVPGTGILPLTVRHRGFRPLWRSRRGHLWFVYPGFLRAIRTDRPDVIHVVSEPWGLLAVQAATASRISGARLVLHGCDTLWHHGSSIERRVRNHVLRWTLPVTAAWLAENDKALALAVASGLPTNSMRRRIHTNPRDATSFTQPTAEVRRRARRRWQVGDDIVVSMIGRLVPEKGVAELLSAAERLLAEGFAGRFLIAGEGPERQIIECSDDPRIRTLGSIAYPADVLALLHASDVLACPSLVTPSWEDQGPRVVLEAMMCGVVPVVTPTGALPPMVGGHGVVSSSTDEADIAAAIRDAARISADPSARATLADWASATYSAGAVAAALCEVWGELAGARSRIT